MSNTCGRILIKLSGEALAGADGSGISANILKSVAGQLADAAEQGVQIGAVIGGGNLFRGAELQNSGVDRTTGDYMGMLATVMNALAMRDAVQQTGRRCSVMSAFPLGPVCRTFNRREAMSLLEQGVIVIFAAGTGNPYFTTDTAASLRAIEINADVMLKATKVDGIYSKDPVKHADAERYERLTFDEALSRNLGVMDMTALVLCRDNGLPVQVFDLMADGALGRILSGEQVGTVVTRDSSDD